MNRYTIYIAASVVCIILPIILFAYGYWYSLQPRVGPVGDGKVHIKFYQVLPLILCVITGVINLPIAINRYKEYKRKL